MTTVTTFTPPTSITTNIYFIDYSDYTDDMNNTDYIHYTTTKLQ